MKQLFCLITFLVFAINIIGQIPDTSSIKILTDTLTTRPVEGQMVEKERKHFVKNLFNFKKDYPSPKKAILLSAILPGAGQVYNKKYWKLPLVYGALGTMGYFISFTNTKYKRYRKAYIYRLDDEELGTTDEFTVLINGVEKQILDAASIKERRDYYRKNKELSYIGFFLAYVLVGVDAFVDAHLLSFDVNDDLSLHIQPQYELLSNQLGALGIHFSLQPKNKAATVLPIQF